MAHDMAHKYLRVCNMAHEFAACGHMRVHGLWRCGHVGMWAYERKYITQNACMHWAYEYLPHMAHDT